MSGLAARKSLAELVQRACPVVMPAPGVRRNRTMRALPDGESESRLEAAQDRLAQARADYWIWSGDSQRQLAQWRTEMDDRRLATMRQQNHRMEGNENV